MLIQFLLFTGTGFEEYVLLADYESKAEGELSVKVGDIVKVINREATGKLLSSLK